MGKLYIELRNAQTEKFPPQCMICAEQQATKSINQNYYYYPPWVYVGLLLGLIPLIILILIFQKQQRVNIQLCELCHSRWKMLPTFGCLVALVAFGILMAMIFFFSENQTVLGFLMLILLIGMPIYYVIAHNNKYAITCINIDDRFITLNVPNNTYPQLYEEYIRTQSEDSRPVICPNCGFQNIPNSKFCEKCGQSIPRSFQS